MSRAPAPVSAPYGAWPSPLSAELVTRAAPAVQEIAVDAHPDAAGTVYWVESRPQEGGRGVAVRRSPEGVIEDRTPTDCGVRSRVHEYGGGALAVDEGVLYFVNETDQRIYRQDPSGPPRPITPEGSRRYADLHVDRARGRLLAVCEDHDAPLQPTASIVAVDLDGGGEPALLLQGHDFYAAPRLSPDAATLAWLTWDHPNMPWDGTDLWRADVSVAGRVGPPRRVAGGPDEAIADPQWGPDGILFFVSDASGWWNLYRDAPRGPTVCSKTPAEFGHPAWIFGRSTYAFLDADRILCALARRGRWSLGLIDIPAGSISAIPTPYGEIDFLRPVPGGAVFLAGGPDRAPTVVRFDARSAALSDLRPARVTEIDPSLISPPEPLAIPTTDGATTHAFYYPPHNPGFRGLRDERPPLIVRTHGGPTAAAVDTLRPDVQFWTSRGFALVDVNYRGSTGFGRDYRRALQGRWGVVDVEDCIAAARFLVERGDVDSDRLAISGGSAGGFTTLAALAFHNIFAAGASRYGVSDLAALARDTHKFESRYLDRLIAPYAERPDLYRARSPLHNAAGISSPVIFFQGSEDRVVPPEQTRVIVRALRHRGTPVATIEFPGERHGFRRAESQARALSAELAFYGAIFGFTPDGRLAPLDIDPPPASSPHP